MAQEPKKVIDVGEIGNASTGDILFDGGVKINFNFQSVYNAFGDQRLDAIANGENAQLIHATGYYQKATQYEFRTPIALGTMWDVDTSTGAVSPIITQGKPGECVEFVNTNGSISVNSPMVISASGGTFAGVSGPLTITAPYSKVVCWCVSASGGVSTWNYSVESMFGDDRKPINATFPIGAVANPIRIAHATEFESIKLMLVCANANKSKMRFSEVNLLINSLSRTVFTNEYSVIRVGNTSEADEIVNIAYDIDSNNYLVMNVTSSTTGMKMAIKSVATQKIGAA